MTPILFVDYRCPEPYDLDTLNTQGLGGTEATVIRIAEKLSEKIPVVVAQHNRQKISRNSLVTYSPLLPSYLSARWHAIVVVRLPQVALELRSCFKDIPMWVWMHDFINLQHLQFTTLMADNKIGYIAVSDYHRNQLIEMCRIDPLLPQMPQIVRIYNPIDDQLAPDDTPVDPNRLVFISAPDKGLSQTLEGFKVLRECNPLFELWITNPSYSRIPTISKDLSHVKYIGSVKHAENIRILRGALCLFSLNYVYPETFGLVLAEANAVGTPVLTHPLGAAQEVLSSDEQLINTHDLRAVIDCVMRWHGGDRLKVQGRKEFRLSTVAKQWEELLLIN